MAISLLAEPDTKYVYKSFPANDRTEEQEEKRRSILALASEALNEKTKPTYLSATYI
jgi:hypothetical protein